MKIVVAQHKGGVGKTSSTHIAGVLSENGLESTLLMDCDTQGDAFRFFTGKHPDKKFSIKNGMDGVDVLWNPERDKISNKSTFNEYDNIVVDINTRFEDSLQIIMELSPDLVLIPIDRQKLSTVHMYEVITTLSEVQGSIMYPFEMRIIQMGSKHDIESILDEIPNAPKTCYEDYRIPYLDNEFNHSLSTSKYVWQKKKHGDIKSAFKEVIYG